MVKKYVVKKLEQLLEKNIDAKRVYYNASEDVQEVDLKRFLAFQSVKRNRFSHEISEQLVQAGITSHTMATQGELPERDWQQESKIVPNKNPLEYLKKCRLQDEENLVLYKEILEHTDLSESILKILEKQQTAILASFKETENFRTGENPLLPERKPHLRRVQVL